MVSIPGRDSTGHINDDGDSNFVPMDSFGTLASAVAYEEEDDALETELRARQAEIDEVRFSASMR